MVRELFGAEPEEWQGDVLEHFPICPRIAMPCSKGPGKTAVLTWCAWNFLLTRYKPKCVVTAITGANLNDNFWTEMSKWYEKSTLLQALFTVEKEKIFSNEFPDTWWLSKRTYNVTADKSRQADTLAGLHADYILFLLDESGGMTDAVMASAEAALSSCIEGHIIQAGNTVQLSGPLYRAVENEHGLWYVVRINGDPDDPKRSKRVDKKWAEDFIKANGGRENDYVRVNVLGLFPRQGFNALIGAEEVRTAMSRRYTENQVGRVARILGIDVARSGTASSAIAKREGIQMYPIRTWRGLTGIDGASIVNSEWSIWEPDGVFIDATGGFGSSWMDQLRMLGRSTVGVHFNQKASQPDRYANKRTEMYLDFINWIKLGGALPDDPELLEDLINVTFTTAKGVLALEPKESVQAKQNGRSPDKGDAGALTFAEPVGIGQRRFRQFVNVAEYNPFAQMEKEFDRSQRREMFN
jgi:phage terminase large subunit